MKNKDYEKRITSLLEKFYEDCKTMVDYDERHTFLDEYVRLSGKVVAEIRDLLETNQVLAYENKNLWRDRETRDLMEAAKQSQLDEMGFWLLDKNFSRSNLSDFPIPKEALLDESEAQKFFIRFFRVYWHSVEQRENVKRLYEQILVVVSANKAQSRESCLHRQTPLLPVHPQE